jgi:hypothetical protein
MVSLRQLHHNTMEFNNLPADLRREVVLRMETSAASVCREWRDWNRETENLAKLMVQRHGAYVALKRAVSARGREALAEELIRHHNSNVGKVGNENAMIVAVRAGNVNAVRLILELPGNAPRADCRDGEALVSAAIAGHAEAVRLLLEWPNHAPRADCRDGDALMWAAKNGHTEVVWLLLEWPIHAPRADCLDGRALVCAAEKGHAEVVRMLLKWPDHAPRADCQDFRAFELAANAEVFWQLAGARSYMKPVFKWLYFPLVLAPMQKYFNR